MSHWVTMVVDGSDTEVIGVGHSFDEAVEVGRTNVSMYYAADDPERFADIAAYNESLAGALSHEFAPQDQSDVQFECGSSSYDIRIVEVK